MLYKQFKMQKNIKLRSRILELIRDFFKKLGFLEVETPIRILKPIPELNIDFQKSGNYFLHSSPELYMKLLLINGYDKIFQICKCFRKDERGSFHLPEMSILEWYEIGSNYKKMMKQTESLLKYIALKLGLESGLMYKNKYINLFGFWDYLTVSDAFKKFSSISCNEAIIKNKFEEEISFIIEPKLGVDKPVFLYDYPIKFSSLAKVNNDNNFTAERFELYCGGLELCNAFSELINPVEQFQRFNMVINKRKSMGLEVYPFPKFFIEKLYNIPAASGNALGLDRLIMFFANANDINEVVTFVP